MRVVSEREGRRAGWRQPPRSPQPARSRHRRSLLRPLPEPWPWRCPGPPPSAFRCSPYLLWHPATSAGDGMRLPPAFTACCPGTRLAPRPDFGGGSPYPCRGGERHEWFGRGGKAALGTAFRGRHGGRMWYEGMISLTLPGDLLFLPALFSGAARSSPGHRSARQAGGLSVPLGGKAGRKRVRRQPISYGDLTLLQTPRQH